MPPINEWIKDKNRYLQSGSRVIAIHNGVMSAATCPGAVRVERWGGTSHETFKAQPDKASGIHLVYQKNGQFFIDIPCHSRVHGRGKAGYDRNFNAACNLSKFDGGEDAFYGFLCLDAVDPDHIDYYLESREDRQYYLRYVSLFFEIKKLLQGEREQEKEFVEECRRALVDGNLVDADSKVVPLIREVIRNYRAANKGAPLPSKDSSLYQGCFLAILDILFVMVGAGRDRIREVEELLLAEGRRPLRYVINGNGKMTVYATLLPEEMETRLGSCPWVIALRVNEKKTRMGFPSKEYTLLPGFSSTEMTIKEWDEAPQFMGKENPCGCRYEEAKNLFKTMEQSKTLVEKWFTTHDDHTFDIMLSEIIESIDKASRSQVERTSVRVPLMLLHYKGRSVSSSWGSERFPVKKSILYWEADALNMLYSFATSKQQRQIEESLSGIYHRPRTHIDDLKKSKGKLGEFGHLFVSEINPYSATATYGKPNNERLLSSTVKLEIPFDFANPGDRITLYQKSTFSNPAMALLEVSEAAVLSKEISAVLNDAAEHKTKAEDEKKYGKLQIMVSETLMPAMAKEDDELGEEWDL